MFKKLLIALAFSAAALSPAAADGIYGAIAHSPVDHTVWAVVDHPTRAAAEEKALAECKVRARQPSSCKIQLAFWNTCGSFALASNGAFGTGWGKNPDIASAYAQETCLNYGGRDCRTMIAICSPGGRGFITPPRAQKPN